MEEFKKPQMENCKALSWVIACVLNVCKEQNFGFMVPSTLSSQVIVQIHMKTDTDFVLNQNHQTNYQVRKKSSFCDAEY